MIWRTYSILLLFALSLSTFASELFPLPACLKKNVDFWRKIYTEYGDTTAVIHDKTRLDIIYKVVDIGKAEQNWQKVEKEKERIADILTALSREAPNIDTLALNRSQRSIYRLWRHVDDPNKFNRARYNLRGQLGLANRFKEGLIRSGQYLDSIEQVFAKYNLPLPLAFIPHVESSFNHKAYSKVGAAGMWQFTRSTGRLYLNINYELDERFDPYLSTEAAAKLLKKNYEELQSWPLAITAYNHGLYGMKRAVSRLSSRDIGKIVTEYKSRRFGFASRNFYCEFLAAKQVAENYHHYHGELELSRPVDYALFELPHFITIKALAKGFNVSVDTLKALNPAFRIPVVNSKRRIPKGYVLRLPYRPKINVEEVYTHLDPVHKHHRQIRDRYYTVRRGDNLSLIARRYKTSIRDLMAMNELSNPHYIRTGQILELPAYKSRHTTTEPGEEMLGGGLKPNRANKNKDAMYTESMDSLKRHYRAFPFKVSFDVPENGSIEVQPEETLGHYADWLQIDTQRLRNINNLRFGEDIQIGKNIHLVFTQVSALEFHRRRLEYHKSLQEDFFSNYRVEGVEHYSIQNGDNLWRICNQRFEIPCWLLAHYNPKKELSRLYPGKKVVVPVISLLGVNEDE